jgi:hypothetical protein
MEYAKDEVFTINYNEEKDKQKTPRKRGIKEKIKKNKIISLFFTIGIIFTVFDVTFVYYFFSLLTKI